MNDTTASIKLTKGSGTLLKYVVIVAAYSFLIYKLVSFSGYSDFIVKWNQIPASRYLWLLAVILFVPVNWLFEVIKWKKLVDKFQKINLFVAIKAVLAGITTGFFTPNRIGDLFGRIIYLDAENRKPGISVSVVNSLTQNLMMIIGGFPAAVLFFLTNEEMQNRQVDSYLFLMGLCLLFLGIIYFFIPKITARLTQKISSAKITAFLVAVSDYNFIDLLQIMLITLLRYVVFCTQFYFVLLFFGVDLSLWQAVLAIPTSYLFVTFTPSVGFSEAAVRSSYAVLFIGAFSGDEISIMLAGISIWLLNFVVPMIVGSVVLAGKN